MRGTTHLIPRQDLAVRFLLSQCDAWSIASLLSTLVAITPLSSPRTQRACASWCPAFMPRSVELTDMSLRLLRCAPSPLRVPGRVLGVGSLRTLSRPDTSPGFDTCSLRSFGFHLLSHPGALSDTGCSRSATLLRGGPLRRSRPLAVLPRVWRCGSTREWRSLAARYRRTGTIMCIRRSRRYCNLLD